MKKIMKSLKLMFIMVLMISLTGCVKLNTTMTITKEDVKISSIVAIQDSMLGQDGIEEPNQEDMEEYKKAGYSVEEYKQDGYTGVKLTKSLGSLDALSKAGKDDIIDLTKIITGENSKLENLFYLDDSTYQANFSFDTDGLTSDLENEMDNDETGTEDDFFSDSDTNDDMSGLLGDDFNADQLMSMFDLKFEVTLPVEAISNNATKVSDDKKTLTWDLTKENNIQFSFKTNDSSAMITYIIIGCIAGIVVAAIVIIVVVNKNKKNKNQMMYTQPMNTPINSMPTQQVNNMNQQNMAVNNTQSPVQPMPGQQVQNQTGNTQQNDINQ